MGIFAKIKKFWISYSEEGSALLSPSYRKKLLKKRVDEMTKKIREEAIKEAAKRTKL